MTSYRETIKEHFESIPIWKKLLAIDYLFWGAGLVMQIIGGSLSATSYPAASTLNTLGEWAVLLGLALAFIKKSDWGLMIGTAGSALYNAAMILVQALRNVVGYETIFDLLGYGVLFVMALCASDVLKSWQLRRAQQAAMFSQRTQPAGGVICASCGAVLIGDAAFCNKCGAKRPEQKACASCGALLADGAEFCNKCGTSVIARIKCPACDADVLADDLFCPKCGAKTRQEAQD